MASRPTLSPHPSRPERLQGGTLYLVSTPIGNLEDITLRALRILKEASLIAAEDTRRTAKLLHRHGIETPTTSFHDHSPKEKASRLLSALGDGDSIALVTDAGTPSFSDPGGQLVKSALARGIKVQAIPGASAILVALAMSGFSFGSFTFLGFPPSRSNARLNWFNDLLSERRTLVLFEAPHRLHSSLADMRSVLGDRTISLCREMTKLHEDLVEGPISLVSSTLEEPRGEFTIIVWPSQKSEIRTLPLPSERDLWNEFCLLTKASRSNRRAVIKLLAEKYGLTAREIYATVERGKESSS